MIRASVAAILGTAALYGPVPAAVAQESQQARPEEALEEIQITGSRILRKDLESISPLVTISAETLENRANLAVESALNELPQFIPSLTGASDINRQNQLGATTNQFNTSSISFSAGSTVGATNVSLRGLGANRNLVLLNGKRLVPVNASMGVDTSSIPSSALQRVEVVTGGASSAYGADAVSGVINFILKENFQGADLDAQYGVTELGDNTNLRISGLVGGNFSDGRGNAMLGVEFTDRGEALQVERDFYRRQYANAYEGIGRNSSFTEFAGGTSPTPLPPFVPYGNLPSQAVVDQIFSQRAPGSVDPNSTFLLNPDGTVFTTDADGHYRFNGDLNGLNYKINRQTDTWVENNLLTRVSSPLRRYSMFGSGHFDATDSLTLYAQTTFAQSKTESVLDPGMAFSSWGILIPHGSGRNCATVGVTSGGCQNTDPLPFNLASFGTWANVPTLAQYQAGGAVGLTCASTGGCTNSQAFPVPTELAMLLDSRQNVINIPGFPPIVIPGADSDFAVNVPMNIFGEARGTTNESTNFQIITGFRGDLHLSDWTYDVYTSYGTSRTTQEATGAASYNKLRLLARQPNYGKGAVLEGNITPPGSTTSNHPTARCTSGLPIFQSGFTGTISEDCVNTVVVNPVTTTRMNQTVVEATFQGGLFELPAGGLRFAAGAGWRENEFEFIPAEILSQESVLDGVVGFNPISGNKNSDEVKEGFAELLVPVLRDLPFAEHLNLELGYRYSEYRYGGTVTTWKALGDWALTEDFRVRGGYQKANRAPNLVELFQKDSDQFLAGPGDPCALNSGLSWSVNPNANGNTPEKAAQVRQVCEAMMGASGAASFYADPNGSNHTDFFNSLGFGFEFPRVSGNPDLKSESSDTWTLGAVLRSPFTSPLAQFSVSVDYFKIEVADAIGIVQLNSLFGGIYRHCYDPDFNTTLDPNDSFCQQVPRDTNTGEKLSSPRLTYSNVGGIVSEGVDLSFNWSAALSDMGVSFIPGRVSYGLNGNYMLDDGRQAAPGEPFEEFTGISGFGTFKWTAFSTFGWFSGPANASLRWRHYPGTQSYTNFAGIDEKAQGVGSYDIFDMSFGYAFGRGLQLRAGIDNLLDKAPPIQDYNPGVGGPGTEDFNAGTVAGGAYDTLGRSYYLGVRMSF